MSPYWVAWTGHRDLADPLMAGLLIEAECERLTREHPRPICITGGALGTDTLVAEYCLAAGLQYTIYLPFPPSVHTQHWSEPNRRHLQTLMEGAVYVGWLGAEYDVALYLRRDEWMVRDADLVIALWSGRRSGGTYHTLSYARRCGVPVRTLRVEEKHVIDLRRGRAIL